jgi:large subunit ribosomal protein L3
MGHRKKHAPKRGSLAFLPRGRAKSHIGKIRNWPQIDGKPTLLGFIGYKAGMTHVFMVDDHSRSPTFGKEVMKPVTIIETPPILICAIRAYTQNEYGLQSFTEVWMPNPPADLNRKLTLPENFNSENGFKKIEENLNKIVEFRLLTATQPKLSSVPKKKPDLMEIKVGGGTIKEQYEYCKGLLGKTVSVPEVFKEGQFIDVISITKGKGFQGPVKRWGIKLLPDKSRKTVRGVAAIGPWKPAHVLYTVPRAGQLGFHQRTEYNKRILKIGNDGKEVSPKGGFIRYGPVKTSYIILEGSLPGSAKRLIRMRFPIRPPRSLSEAVPQLTYIFLDSPQGK